MARYLSQVWFDEVNRAAADNADLAVDTAGVDLTIQQVVTGAPEGDIRYAVLIRNGEVELRPGDDAGADVTITEDWDTAKAVASGSMSAPTAFMTGRIRVGGNVGVLLDAQGCLQGLDKVFADLRDRTEF